MFWGWGQIIRGGVLGGLLAVSFSAEALLGVGNLVADSGRYQKNRKGEKQEFEFAPYFSLHERWEFARGLEFVPELAFAFHKTPSPNHSRMTILLLYPVSWKIWPRHFLRGGLGNMITRVAGKGGSVLMNNGNGYSYFANPSGAKYSASMTALLGYEFLWREFFGLRAESFWVPLRTNPMEFAFSVSMNFYYF